MQQGGVDVLDPCTDYRIHIRTLEVPPALRQLRAGSFWGVDLKASQRPPTSRRRRA